MGIDMRMHLTSLNLKTDTWSASPSCNYMGHNYVGHSYIGHNCLGHNDLADLDDRHVVGLAH